MNKKLQKYVFVILIGMIFFVPNTILAYYNPIYGKKIDVENKDFFNNPIMENNVEAEIVNHVVDTLPVVTTVFDAHTEGYQLFRIPSLLSLPNGRILAIAEARGTFTSDCAENDIVLRYSDNGGSTWSPLVMMAESGKASLNNPTSVYVEEISRVIVLFQEYPQKTNENLTESGLEGDKITRTYMIYSDDYGETWSKKRDITRQIKLPKATGYASGPGAALRVTTGPDKGRILVPLNVTGSNTDWYNYLVASDDLGQNWFILPGESMYGTNESQVVQISDTTFLVNARCHRYFGDDVETPEGWNPWNTGNMPRCRAFIPVTINGKRTEWHPTEIRQDLPDPVCQGAMIRYSGLDDGQKSRLLMSNPANNEGVPSSRVNGMVRMSYDEGKTWQYSKRFYGDENTECQYSTLARLKSGDVGCLFESEGKILFAKFSLEWLTD